MWLQRIPDEYEEGKEYDEDAEEIMNNNESLQMMNIINQLLLDRGDDQINVLDWAMLCPHQEEWVFDCLFDCHITQYSCPRPNKQPSCP